MKKSMFKRLVGFGLAFVMSVGLCACGGSSGEGTGVMGGGSGSKKEQSANNALAKEGVFHYEQIELPIEGQDWGITCSAIIDQKIYLLVSVYDWEKSNDVMYRLVAMDQDGSNSKVYEMQKAPASEQEEETTSSSEGKTTPGSEEETAQESSADEGAVIDPGYVQPYEGTSFSNFLIREDGVYGIKNYYYEDYTDSENPIYENTNYLCRWDAEGNMLWQSELDLLNDTEHWSYVQTMYFTPDGKLTLLFGGDQPGFMEVTGDGKLGTLKKVDDSMKPFTNLSNCFVLKDGKILIQYYDDTSGNYKECFAKFDPATGTMEESADVPASIMYNYNSIQSGVTTDLIITNSSGILTYNLGDAEPKMIMNYVNSDLSSYGVNSIQFIDEEHFIGFFYDESQNSQVGAIFTYIPPEQIPDKEVLVLASSFVDFEVQTRVVKFNKESDKYRIVTKDYSSYNTSEDWTAGQTQLNNDIITGGMPDILIDSNFLPIENYVSKGLLMDIDALIAQDEELSKVEFLQNVFDAFRIGGKLYQVIPGYSVRTMAAKKSLVGDRVAWTVDDAMNMVKSLGPESSLVSEWTRETFLSYMMQYCGSDFVDVETGKCSFDSENFIKLLELARELPESLDVDYNDESYWEEYNAHYYTQYRENRTILKQCYIYSIRELNYTINGDFGEDVSFVGFPTESEQGSVISPASSFLISSKTACPEGAWEFVRYYLSEEYQSEHSYMLPTRKDVFEDFASHATEKPYYIDENGEKVEYDETYWINEESIPLEPLNQSQVDAIKNFLYTVSKKEYNNEAILNIITEECGAFFSGQKSAQDVAGIIQSRVQIYVNENR